MTTIAVRDGVMASDSVVTVDEVRSHQVRKIHDMGHGWLLGLAGTMSHCSIVVHMLYGLVQDAPPDLVVADLEDVSDGEFEAQGLLAHSEHGVYFLTVEPRGSVTATPLEGEFHSLGTGMHMAIAAMMAGASAEQAVNIACKLDPNSDGPVVTKRLSNIVHIA